MTCSTGTRRSERLPSWLRRAIPLLADSSRIEGAVRRNDLRTICREGLCPNRAECYAKGKVTFMMLGEVCTRGCGFCSVAKGVPGRPDPGEPARIAAAASELGLTHVIVTSVTRDDLPDGGAGAFASVTRELRALDPVPVVEVLVPDFGGSIAAVETVAAAAPDIVGHNVETVRRLYPSVRRGADYGRSLGLLAAVRRFKRDVRTKSALMLGLGETTDEVLAALSDLREARVDFVALGQYLRPGLGQTPVREYVAPAAFDHLAERAREMGFVEVTAGPLVRSSYQENRVPARGARTGTQPAQ
jgi:lipoic acid synthetase